MNTKLYNGKIRHLSSEDYYKKMSNISCMCEKVEVFKFEGRYFAGGIIHTIKAYLNENPSKSFFVWLIDNGLEVRQD